MHELPDEYLADALPIAKKIALAQGLENYNILQVRLAFPLFFASSLHATIDTEQRAHSTPRSGPRPLPCHPKTQRERGYRLPSRNLARNETLHGRTESIPCRITREAGSCG